MLNAKDWVVDVSDHVGAALLVLAISGFSVTIAWSLLDLGRAGAIVGGLVLLALVIGEGAYQAWRDIAVQVAADDAGDDPRDQLREALTDLPRVRRIIRRSENPSVQALEPAIEAANEWEGRVRTVLRSQSPDLEDLFMSDEGLVDDPAQAFYVNNGAEMFAVVARREDRLNLLLDHWPLARVECQRLRLADFIKCRDIFQAKLQAPQDESENHRVRALIDLWVHRIRAYLAEDLPAWVDSFSTENFTPQSPGELATSPDLAAYMPELRNYVQSRMRCEDSNRPTTARSDDRLHHQHNQRRGRLGSCRPRYRKPRIALFAVCTSSQVARSAALYELTGHASGGVRNPKDCG